MENALTASSSVKQRFSLSDYKNKRSSAQISPRIQRDTKYNIIEGESELEHLRQLLGNDISFDTKPNPDSEGMGSQHENQQNFNTPASNGKPHPHSKDGNHGIEIKQETDRDLAQMNGATWEDHVYSTEFRPKQKSGWFASSPKDFQSDIKDHTSRSPTKKTPNSERTETNYINDNRGRYSDGKKQRNRDKTLNGNNADKARSKKRTWAQSTESDRNSRTNKNESFLPPKYDSTALENNKPSDSYRNLGRNRNRSAKRSFEKNDTRNRRRNGSRSRSASIDRTRNRTRNRSRSKDLSKGRPNHISNPNTHTSPNKNNQIRISTPIRSSNNKTIHQENGSNGLPRNRNSKRARSKSPESIHEYSDRSPKSKSKSRNNYRNDLSKSKSSEHRSDKTKESKLLKGERESSSVTVRSVFPYQDGGIIIGTKGSHLAKLRKAVPEVEWYISSSTTDKQDRLLVVKGRPDDVSEAYGELARHFLSQKAYTDYGLPFGPKSSQTDIDSSEPFVAIRFLMPHRTCGAVIGHNSDTLHLIKQKGRACRLKVYHKFFYNSRERVVEVIGTPKSVRKVTLFISKQVEEFLSRDQKDSDLYVPRRDGLRQFLLDQGAPERSINLVYSDAKPDSTVSASNSSANGSGSGKSNSRGDPSVRYDRRVRRARRSLSRSQSRSSSRKRHTKRRRDLVLDNNNDDRNQLASNETNSDNCSYNHTQDKDKDKDKNKNYTNDKGDVGMREIKCEIRPYKPPSPSTPGPAFAPAPQHLPERIHDLNTEESYSNNDSYSYYRSPSP